ncbi:protein kinase domain-containing protein [Aquabacterium humicola]|uniref:protein kinase domain-containing protein n=1 Tax=Aquabacterium humicola TaxID=3237377 RepID=UPI002542C44C|nr:hypothetical protein [Rubrivivax pictus]
MTTYHAALAGRRTPIVLDDPMIGRGGEANVYRVRGLPGQVAKIYHNRASAAHADRAKLEAMIATPPERATGQANGQTLPLFAWPATVVEDDGGSCCGFLMPEIPLERAVTLHGYMSLLDGNRLLSPDDRSLPRRLLVCRNLAAAIAELHRQRHYFVDIKPQNIYLFKDTGIVCLVDNDSFSIAGRDGRRFPASAYSAEYVAPELLKGALPASSVVDDRQDCFALAVLMFRLLDNGLHPFQGIPTRDVDEWNIDLSIERGYYPHGKEPDPAIRPAPSSTCDLWDASTRAMFDRALGSRLPSLRPSAAEWRDHFDRLQQQGGVFVKCERRPANVLHIHFAGMGCPECRLESLDTVTPVPPPPPSAPAELPPLAAAPAKKDRRWAYALAGIGVVGVILARQGEKVPEASEAAPPAVATRAPARVPAPKPAIPAPPPLAPAPPEPAPPRTTGEMPSTDDASLARSMSDAGQADALQARWRIVERAISDVAKRQQDELLAVLKAAWAGDDAQTLASAQAALRQIAWDQHYNGWTRFRVAARQLNTEALAQGSDPARAFALEAAAVALDPYDREIAGNMGYFLARKGNAAEANLVAVYALSLPRNGATDTGRGADWQLLGSSLAKLGKADHSLAAYYVALATTPNLAGLCASVLAQQAALGEELKAPIDRLFQRIQQRGQDSTEGCAYPPRWRN